MNIIDSNWQEHLPGGCKFVTIEPFFLIWFLFYTRIIEREWEKFWSLSSWRWALVHDFSTLPFKQREMRRICKKQIERVFFLPSYIYNNQLDTSIQVEFAHPLQTRPFVFFWGRLFFSPGKVFHRRGGWVRQLGGFERSLVLSFDTVSECGGRLEMWPFHWPNP